VVELFAGVATVIIHDKELLDGQDLHEAEIVVYGKGGDPVMLREDERAFVSPGLLLHDRGGVLLLEEELGDIVASILDATGKSVRREIVVSFSGRACLTDLGSNS